MRTLIIAAVALSLGGCAGIGDFLSTPQAKNTIGARILSDLQGCSRDYRGAISPTNLSGSFVITCDPIVKDGSHLERAGAPR